MLIVSMFMLFVSTGLAAPSAPLGPDGARVVEARRYLDASGGTEDASQFLVQVQEAAKLLVRARQAGEPGAEQLIGELEEALVLLIALHAIDPSAEDIRIGVDLAEEYVTLLPDSPLGWHAKGWFLVRAGEDGPARKAYRQAIKRIEADEAPPDPGYADTYVELAHLSSPRQAEALVAAGLAIVERDRARGSDSGAYDEAETDLRDRARR
jgi:tetratricopeptide (TPR) repeat protein